MENRGDFVLLALIGAMLVIFIVIPMVSLVLGTFLYGGQYAIQVSMRGINDRLILADSIAPYAPLLIPFTVAIFFVAMFGVLIYEEHHKRKYHEL